MIIEQMPQPEEDKIGLVNYIMRMWQNVAAAIDAVNGIKVVDIEPFEPKRGAVYYLKTEHVQWEGLYYYVDGAWHFVKSDRIEVDPTTGDAPHKINL